MEKIGILLGIKDRKLLRYVVLVIIISFLSGILAIALRYPMSWYDEGTHLTRIINIVNFDDMKRPNNNWYEIGGDVSVAQNYFIDNASFSKERIGVNWIENYWEIPYSEEKMFKPTTNTIINNPIVYTPYIIAGFFTKLFHCKPVIEYLIIKIVGFLFFFLCYLFSIRKTPTGKFTFSLLGVAPTVILSFSAISADNYLITMSAIYLAVVFNLYYHLFDNIPVDNKDIVELLLVSLLLVLGKIPVFLLIGLLLPYAYIGMKKNLISTKKLYLIMIIILLCAIITLSWVYLLRNVNTGAFWSRNVDTGQQLRFILSDIKKFIILWISSIMNYHFFGLQIGYAESERFGSLFCVPCALFFISLLLSFGIKDAEEDRILQNNSSYDRIYNLFVLLIVIIYVVCVFLAIYLQFSEIGSDIIDGVQPRYFIPLWLLIVVNYTYGLNISKERLPFIFLLSLLPLVNYHLLMIVQL